MRKFSEYEKEIIKRIVAGSENSLSYVLINAYDDIFYHAKVEYKINTNILKFYELTTNLLLNKFLLIEKNIIITSLLIQFLVENRYVFLVNDTTTTQDITLGNFPKDGLVGIEKDISPEISTVLSYSAVNRIVVSFDLVSLVENNFKTLEEEGLEEARAQTSKAIKSVKLAFWAIIISSLSIIISVLMPIYYTSTIKVDKNQIAVIKNEEAIRSRKLTDQLNSVNLKMDSILKVNRKHANKENK